MSRQLPHRVHLSKSYLPKRSPKRNIRDTGTFVAEFRSNLSPSLFTIVTISSNFCFNFLLYLEIPISTRPSRSCSILEVFIFNNKRARTWVKASRRGSAVNIINKTILEACNLADSSSKVANRFEGQYSALEAYVVHLLLRLYEMRRGVNEIPCISHQDLVRRLRTHVCANLAFGKLMKAASVL